MLSNNCLTDSVQDVPQALIRALLRHPRALQSALTEAGLAPHDLAIWARGQGDLADVEKVAGWLAVSQRPGAYKPLLEVAGSHLRAGDLEAALPVFRWAYQAWQAAPGWRAAHRYDGAKLLALWGECLYRLDQSAEAQQRWLWALDVAPDAETLTRLARAIERAEAGDAYAVVLSEAVRRRLPGAAALQERWERINALTAVESDASDAKAPQPQLSSRARRGTTAVLADVANLDLVCGEQFGYGRRLDYGRLLQAAEHYGPVVIKLACVPNVPDTLDVREHLIQAGFEIDLKRPKRSHGRIVANADTAMAAFAVRWASDPQIERLELWTGDGDFVKVREVVTQAWPEVAVAFRSFEIGTAAEIRQLEQDWLPIGVEYLQNLPGF